MNLIDDLYRLVEPNEPSDATKIVVISKDILKAARRLEAFFGGMDKKTASALGLDWDVTDKIYDLLGESIIPALEGYEEN
jgi:hypothetical protein